MVMLASQILDAAAAKIEPEGAWCQDNFARDAGYKSVSPRDLSATCFCMAGAIFSAMEVAGYEASDVVFRLTESVIDTGRSVRRNIPAFNDAPETTQADAVAALRAAADLARARGE